MIIIRTESCSSRDLTPLEIQYLDALQTAEDHEFNLDILRDNAELPPNKLRMKRNAFVIVCYSYKTKEDIMKHIQKEFNNLIQYICISSPAHESEACSTSHPPQIFIQIILQRVVIRKRYFLKDIAGKQCNYRVTCNDRAWNVFLKKVGPYVEDVIFKSVMSRAGIKRPENIPQTHKSSNHTQHPIIENPTSAVVTLESLLNKVKESIQEAIDFTNQHKFPKNDYERNKDVILSLL